MPPQAPAIRLHERAEVAAGRRREGERAFAESTRQESEERHVDRLRHQRSAAACTTLPSKPRSEKIRKRNAAGGEARDLAEEVGVDIARELGRDEGEAVPGYRQLPARDGGAAGRGRRDELVVKPLGRRNHGLDGESLGDAGATPEAPSDLASAGSSRIRWMASASAAGSRGRDEEARLAVGDQLGIAADPRGDHRLARGHGLHDGVRHALLHRGQDGDVAGGEQPRHIPPRPGEDHATAEPERLRLALQVGLQAAPADHEERTRSAASARRWPPRRRNVRGVLLRLEPGEEADHRVMRGDAELLACGTPA